MSWFTTLFALATICVAWAFPTLRNFSRRAPGAARIAHDETRRALPRIIAISYALALVIVVAGL